MISAPSSASLTFWSLLSSLAVGMILYILSVRTTGRYSFLHTHIFTGLKLLTPLFASHQQNEGDSQAVNFHATLLLPGSIPLQALQQMQQQQQQRQQPRQSRSNRTLSPELRLWKHLDAVGCLAASCICFLASQCVFRWLNSEMDICTNQVPPLGFSWFSWMVLAFGVTTWFNLARQQVIFVQQQQQHQQPQSQHQETKLNWMLLFSASPKSVVHAIFAFFIVTICVGWNNPLQIASAWQEVCARFLIAVRLLFSSQTNQDETFLLGIGKVFAAILQGFGTATIVFWLAESVNGLQTSLWHQHFNSLSLSQTMAMSKSEGETTNARLNPGQTSYGRKARNAISYLVTRCNLWVWPLCILLLPYTIPSIAPTGIPLILLLWNGSLLVQLPSLLQEHVLSAMVVCAPAIFSARPSSSTQQQQDWVTQVFQDRKTNLLPRASQWFLWPSGMFMLLCVLCGTAGTVSPSFSSSPVLFQVPHKNDFSTPWHDANHGNKDSDLLSMLQQELLDWNRYQQDCVVMNADDVEIPACVSKRWDSWSSRDWSRLSSRHELDDTDAVIHDTDSEESALLPFLIRPSDLFAALDDMDNNKRNSLIPPFLPARSLFSHIKMIQEFVRQAQNDPIMRTSLFGSFQQDTRSMERDQNDSNDGKARETLQMTRFLFSILANHAVVSNQSWYHITLFLVYCLTWYWVVSATLLLIFGHKEFQKQSKIQSNLLEHLRQQPPNQGEAASLNNNTTPKPKLN